MPDEWRDKVFKTIWECPAHIFQILTKNPENIEPYVTRRGGTERWVNYPDNLWLGTSVDYAKNIKRIEHLTDSRIYADVKFASFEPLKECMDGVDLSGLDWIIIGGQTGQKEFIPPESWVVSILDAAGANGIPVFLKDNLFFDKQIREFPKI